MATSSLVASGFQPNAPSDPAAEFASGNPGNGTVATRPAEQDCPDKQDQSAGLSNKWRHIYGPARPDPWLQRKFAVIFLIALTLWSFYVVVGRVCAPALQGVSSQGYSVGTGAGTLVGFTVLWLMFAWSYMKMVLTGPGFARNHVPRVPRPPPNPPSTTYLPYRYPNGVVTDRPDITSDPAGPDPSEVAPIGHALGNAVHLVGSQQRSSSATLQVDQGHRVDDKVERTKTGKDLSEVERPVPKVNTAPRWCQHCEIFKPDRTHHCRHCGTCVMQFDHHCLWIGQCVGWRNHKFFIIFNFWAALFCIYILVFLAISLSRSDSVDGQVIGLTVCAGFFAIFTITMCPTHVHLILEGKTTVESFAGRDQTEMENSVLHREFGFMWKDHDKRKVRRRWKEEFGGINVDDRWKVGTWKDRWRVEMGADPLGWFLPIGRPQGDGLHFPSHVAFGPHGEWLKKRDWPHDTRA